MPNAPIPETAFDSMLPFRYNLGGRMFCYPAFACGKYSQPLVESHVHGGKGMTRRRPAGILREQ